VVALNAAKSGHSGPVGLQSGCSSRRHGRVADFRFVPAKAPAAVREEITRQQRLDRQWGAYQHTLQARLTAVLGAHRAFSERQLGADWALRQSLVDLASVCELLAGELEPPGAA
jgi:hypothetical protein